jgi:predicted dehydrogenase
MMAQVGHLPFYLDDPRCDVVAIAEERSSIVEALIARLGPDRVVPERRLLVERADIDALVLSVPRPATGPLTLEALEAGKHVFVEKPMAHSAEQARRLVEAARARNLTYAVGFMKRYDPGVQKAKALFAEVTASARFGRLLLARFYDYSKSYAMAPPAHVRPKESRTVRYPTWPTWPDWLSERYHGPYEWFLNAACHDVNLITHFFPDGVDVRSAQVNRDGAIAATLRWRNVPIALDVAKTEAGRWLEGAEFLFERGRIGLSIPSPMAVDCVSRVELDDLAAGAVRKVIDTGAGWCFERQAAAFIDALTGEGSPLTSGSTALADMELIESMWRQIEE